MDTPSGQAEHLLADANDFWIKGSIVSQCWQILKKTLGRPLAALAGLSGASFSFSGARVLNIMHGLHGFGGRRHV